MLSMASCVVIKPTPLMSTYFGIRQPIYNSQDFSFVHYTGDTLYSPEDYFLPDVIYNAWVKDSSWNGTNSVIDFIDSHTLCEKKGMCDEFIIGAKFALSTEDKDTLYLVNDNILSYLTYECWRLDSEWRGENPRIVFKEKEAFLNLLDFETNIMVSKVSENCDTLYLRDDHLVSYITYQVWEDNPLWDGTNPYIKFLTSKEFDSLDTYGTEICYQKIFYNESWHLLFP